MAFNANTYYANKARRQAWEELAYARAIKARVAAGTAYAWELPRVTLYAELARHSMHLHLLYRKMGVPR